jgi:hypothetical protein
MAVHGLTKSDPQAVKNADIARLGATAYATKKKVTPGRWKRIVKDAHAKGFTVDSFLDTNTPDQLKARTQTSLTSQATKTIASAYAPAETELTQAEARAKSIGDKRTRDNQYYLDWLTARSGELNAHAQAADEKLLERNKQIADELGAHNDALKSNLVSQAQPTQSDPNQSTAIANTADEAKRSNEVVANARQASSDMVANNEKRNASDQAINFAQVAAMQASAQADTYKQLQGVADERTKLALAKAGDSSKEVARLLNQEVDKANSNREFGAALSKLGIANDANKIRLTGIQTTSKDKAKQRSLTAAIADRTASQRDTEIQLKGDRLSLDWYKTKHPNSGKKGGKGKNTQEEFDRSVALLQSSVFTRPTKDGKDVEVIKSKREYVLHRKDEIIAQIMKKEKVSREVAERAFRAYVQHEDNNPGTAEDPGSFKLYGKKGPPTPKK